MWSLFWFLFLREPFDNIPIDDRLCNKCNEITYNKNTGLNPFDFRKNCIDRGGLYTNTNNIRKCNKHKGIVDSNYNCNCNI